MELFWKRCKHSGKLDTWRREKPEPILPEILAKLLGVVFTQWLTLLGCWSAPNRRLLKAKPGVSWMTPCLALALAGKGAMTTVVEQTASTMRGGCHLDSRHQKPNPSQLLADPLLIRGLG